LGADTGDIVDRRQRICPLGFVSCCESSERPAAATAANILSMTRPSINYYVGKREKVNRGNAKYGMRNAKWECGVSAAEPLRLRHELLTCVARFALPRSASTRTESEGRTVG
jgi:hypothetical protein